MDSHEKLQSLRNLFDDISKKLSTELAKAIPNACILLECRRQLMHIDKDIRRIQIQKHQY